MVLFLSHPTVLAADTGWTHLWSLLLGDTQFCSRERKVADGIKLGSVHTELMSPFILFDEKNCFTTIQSLPAPHIEAILLKLFFQNKMAPNSIHWFRKGLRLHDNPALREAVRGADTVRCVYFLDPWFAGSSNVGVNRWR